MKLLIASCIFIIFSVSDLHAEPGEDSDLSQCGEQLENRSRLRVSCTYAVFDENQFNADMESTVVLVYSSDNMVAINKFAAIYCPILHQVLNCSMIEGDVDAKCLRPNEAAETARRYAAYEAALTYICANEGNVLVRVAQNNGLETVYKNRKFEECYNLLFNQTKLNDETYATSQHLCDAVDYAIECYANYVWRHDNSFLVAVSTELHEVFYKAINCTPDHYHFGDTGVKFFDTFWTKKNFSV